MALIFPSKTPYLSPYVLEYPRLFLSFTLPHVICCTSLSPQRRATAERMARWRAAVLERWDNGECGATGPQWSARTHPIEQVPRWNAGRTRMRPSEGCAKVRGHGGAWGRTGAPGFKRRVGLHWSAGERIVVEASSSTWGREREERE